MQTKSFFPTKNGLCAVFHGFAQDDPRSGCTQDPGFPSTPPERGSSSWTSFSASLYLPGHKRCSELSHRDVSTLKVSKIRSKMCICIYFYCFGFHMEATVGQREQLHFKLISIINQIPISFLFLKVQLCWRTKCRIWPTNPSCQW